MWQHERSFGHILRTWASSFSLMLAKTNSFSVSKKNLKKNFLGKKIPKRNSISKKKNFRKKFISGVFSSQNTLGKENYRQLLCYKSHTYETYFVWEIFFETEKEKEFFWKKNSKTLLKSSHAYMYMGFTSWKFCISYKTFWFSSKTKSH